jgi:hypothetical protein
MTLKQVAKALLVFKPFLNCIFVFSIIFIVYLFLNSSITEQNRYAIPSLLLGTWSLLLSALIGLLVRAPDVQNGNKGWFWGIKHRLAKGFFRFILIVFILLSLALLHATIKLLGLWPSM